MASNNGKSPNENTNPFLMGFGALIFLLRDIPRDLKRNAYGRGFFGGFIGLLGTLAGIGVATSMGRYIQHSSGIFTLFNLARIAAWWVTYSYAFPLLWSNVIKPMLDFAGAINSHIQHFIDKVLPSYLLSFVTATGFGIKGVWNELTRTGTPDKKQRSDWFSITVGILEMIAGVSISAYYSYHLFSAVSSLGAAHLLTHALTFISAVALSVLVFTITSCAIFHFATGGNRPQVAILTSAVAVALLFHKIAALTAGFGITGTVVAVVGAFVFGASYAYPLLDLLFTSKKVLDICKDYGKVVLDNYYDEDEKPLRDLFHHLSNLVVSPALGLAAYVIAGSLLAYSLPVSLSAAIVVTLVSYVLFFKAINHDGGNALMSIFSAIGAGCFAGYKFSAHAGIFSSSLVGAAYALLVALVVFPLPYAGLRWLLLKTKYENFTKKLAAAYSTVNGWFKSLVTMFDVVYDSCYKDESTDPKKPKQTNWFLRADAQYKKAFLHAANIGLSAVAYLNISAALSGHPLASVMLAAVGAVLSYLLVGKLLFSLKRGADILDLGSVGRGVDLVGTMASVWVSLAIGSAVYAVFPHYYLSIPVVIIATWFIYALIFPGAFLIVRVIFGYPLRLLLSVFEPVFDALWGVFATLVADPVMHGYEAMKELLKPVMIKLSNAYNQVRQGYEAFLSRVRGRKKNPTAKIK